MTLCAWAAVLNPTCIILFTICVLLVNAGEAPKNRIVVGVVSHLTNLSADLAVKVVPPLNHFGILFNFPAKSACPVSLPKTLIALVSLSPKANLTLFTKYSDVPFGTLVPSF